MKKVFLISFFFYYSSCFAQNEYEHWMVPSPPDYEINFCDSTYLLSIDSVISGVNGPGATISDKSTGQLLFFTDGQNVWNKVFEPMPNGNGLMGGTESFQAALIVPQPGSSTIFYLFTTDRGDINGLNYSIVDMSKDGGLGDVTVKNVFLDSASQRLNAVYDAANNSFWVISDNPVTNNFMSFKLDDDGLNTTPVLSPTHIAIDTIFQTGPYLKSSPDGEHVVSTYEGQPPIATLYNFNKSTGALNLQTFLPVGSSDGYVFGASFSPNNSKLYLSAGIVGASEIYQYNITSSDTNTIKASQLQIASLIANDRFTGMQMGPDGKIYVAREQFEDISVINEPNLSGSTCQFVLDEITTPSQNFNSGFNNNIDGLYYFATAPNINLSGSVACNKTASFTINTQKTYNYFKVYFGDSTNVSLDSTQHTFTHQYSSAGTYTVKLYTAIGCVYDSATTTVTVDTTKCPGSLIIPNFIYTGGSQTQWHINSLPTNTAVTLYDELGRIIYKTSNYPNNYDMRNLPSAMYFYRLDLQNGEEYTGKILVIK